jgi:hypothetical protein
MAPGVWAAGLGCGAATARPGGAPRRRALVWRVRTAPLVAAAAATLAAGAAAAVGAAPFAQGAAGSGASTPGGARVLASLEPTCQYWGAQALATEAASLLLVDAALPRKTLCAALQTADAEASRAARVQVRAALAGHVAVIGSDYLRDQLTECQQMTTEERFENLCEVLGTPVIRTASHSGSTPMGNYQPAGNRTECGDFGALTGPAFALLQGGLPAVVALSSERNHFAAAFDQPPVLVLRACVTALYCTASFYAAVVLYDRLGDRRTPGALKVVLCGNVAMGLVLALVTALDGSGTAQRSAFTIGPMFFFKLLLFGQSAALDILLAGCWDAVAAHVTGEHPAGSGAKSKHARAFQLAALLVSLADWTCAALFAYQRVSPFLYFAFPAGVGLAQIVISTLLVIKGRRLHGVIMRMRNQINAEIAVPMAATEAFDSRTDQTLRRLRNAGLFSAVNGACTSLLLLLGGKPLLILSPTTFVSCVAVSSLLRCGSIFSQCWFCEANHWQVARPNQVQPASRDTGTVGTSRAAAGASRTASQLSSPLAPPLAADRLEPTR